VSDTIVIGAGIGGSAIAALRCAKGDDVRVFEASSYAGGCAGTFIRKGVRYNAGAATLAGFSEGMPAHQLYTQANCTLKGYRSIDPAITVIVEEHCITRFRDFERFLSQIDRAWPHPKNRLLWQRIYDLSLEFYATKPLFFGKSRIDFWVRTLMSLLPVALQFRMSLLRSASDYINALMGEIPKAYKAFIDHQILIAAQVKSDEVSIIVAALALGYTFFENGYTDGGMGEAITPLLQGVEVGYRQPIKGLRQTKKGWEVWSDKERFSTERVILNPSLFSLDRLECDPAVRAYFLKTAKPFTQTQGAFMVYGTCKIEGDFSHHYQIITERCFPFGISESLFFSPADAEDVAMQKEGYLSFTISTHTDVGFWQSIPKETYQSRKQTLGEALLKALTKALPQVTIQHAFFGTPKSFNTFTGRFSVGGIPLSRRHFTPSFPAPNTPFKGLYRVGDTVFAGQGWIGVALGALNLNRVIDAS